jgi:TolB-like protein/Tfp pilus assembly protein PilF
MGTVNYMSPEQAKGENVDERTDIFSFGAVIYEMIAGKMPFAGDSLPETFANLINQEAEPLSHFAANVPEELQKIVTRMLAKNKDERYQNIKEALVDLENLKENLTFEEKLQRFASPSDVQATVRLQATTGGAKGQIAETKNNFTQKIKRHKLLIVFSLMIFLIGGIGFGYFYLFPKKTASVTNGKKTIAVLPFVNASRDADAEYLSDGITENVINNLSRLSGLKVRGKSSVLRYKGKEIDQKKVSEELGAEALVIGDIKQLGDKIVINVSLIDPRDGSQIWGKQFVKNSTDVIATQNEIAQSVAQNLRLALTDAEKQMLAKRPTENAEAWRLYSLGRLFGQQATPDGMNKSIELGFKAIEKDPKFALAYSDIGMRYMTLGIYFEPPHEMMPKAKDFANKALQIDSTLSEPHIVLGTIALLYDWDWDKAKEELAEGNIVNLQFIEAFNCAAHVLQVTGRTSEADESLHRALENDPLSISLTTELGCNSYYAGRYDESITKYREALVIEPRNFMAVYGLARTLNHKKQYAAAIDELQKAGTFMPMLPPIAVAEAGYAFARMGEREEAEKHLKMLGEASKQIFVDPFFMATVYLGLGDNDRTLAWLEKSYEARSTLMPTIIGDAKWNDLRSDARFQTLLTRMGIESKTD